MHPSCTQLAWAPTAVVSSLPHRHAAQRQQEPLMLDTNELLYPNSARAAARTRLCSFPPDNYFVVLIMSELQEALQMIRSHDSPTLAYIRITRRAFKMQAPGTRFLRFCCLECCLEISGFKNRAGPWWTADWEASGCIYPLALHLSTWARRLGQVCLQPLSWREPWIN